LAELRESYDEEESEDDDSDDCSEKGVSEGESPDLDIMDHNPWPEDEMPKDVLERVQGDLKAAKEADRELIKSLIPEVSSHGVTLI
jgi:hypothetical protein